MEIKGAPFSHLPSNFSLVKWSTEKKRLKKWFLIRLGVGWVEVSNISPVIFYKKEENHSFGWVLFLSRWVVSDRPVRVPETWTEKWEIWTRIFSILLACQFWCPFNYYVVCTHYVLTWVFGYIPDSSSPSIVK